ncbi:unnamed protein product [Closterium sp. Yama58-4]|nr:unnamed protein product [Closterium sp. Yama58-4]
MWSRTEAAPAGSPTTFLRGEMGAQWIEGATGNPVTTLARKFKLNIGQQNGREIQFTAKGRRYGDAEWAAAEAEYQTLRKMFYKPYAQSRLAVDYEFNFGTALSHLSAWYYDSKAFDPPTMVVTNGYDNIPKMLMQAFDPPTMVVTNGYDNIPKMLMQAGGYPTAMTNTLKALMQDPKTLRVQGLGFSGEEGESGMGKEGGKNGLVRIVVKPFSSPLSLAPFNPLLPIQPRQEAQGKGAKLLLNFEVTAISQSPTGVQITGKNTSSKGKAHSHSRFHSHPPQSLSSLANPPQEAQGKGAKLLLNFEVTAISQSSTGVQITGKNTASGATGTLDADVVIVTIPLGVLKANTIAFNPPLPPRKTGAISRLGVGAIAKIFFFFNQTFWPVNVDEYFIEDSQLPANRGRWVDWVNLKRAWGQTALEGVALGEYAERVATMSDEEVINDAKAKMARMFPQYRKKPVEALATWIQRWTAEPYSRGAYSYARVGVRGNEDHCTDYDVMALPEGRVLFAGEHTIWQYQATVHGALLSGVREARRVLRNF